MELGALVVCVHDVELFQYPRCTTFFFYILRLCSWTGAGAVWCIILRERLDLCFLFFGGDWDGDGVQREVICNEDEGGWNGVGLEV
jgi:hypothetical protein